MHDMNEVMAKAPSNDNINGVTTEKVPTGQTFWGLTANEWGTQIGIGTRTLSPDTNAVDAGYYAATNLSEVDTDLASTNIRVDVTLFGVTGTVYECSVPKTGQTTVYRTGDDGDLQKGVSWPVPRFTVGTGTNGTNLVTDNTTGLMWARNANMWGNIGWTNAITNCNSLVYGGYDDWRLPNAREMYSLLHFGFSSPVVPDTQGTGQWSQNDPFTGVGSVYWSSTTDMATPANAWRVPYFGGVSPRSKATAEHYVWPVRGGP